MQIYGRKKKLDAKMGYEYYNKRYHGAENQTDRWVIFNVTVKTFCSQRTFFGAGSGLVLHLHQWP